MNEKNVISYIVVSLIVVSLNVLSYIPFFLISDAKVKRKSIPSKFFQRTPNFIQ